MGLGEKLLFFFSALGAFNGFVLSIYFFFFANKKRLSDYLLGGLLFVLSIRIGKSVAYFFDYSLPRIYLQIGLTACLFIGPFLYFFIKSETQQIRKFPRLWMLQMLFWLSIIVTAGMVYPYERFPALWGDYFVPFIYTQWGVYILLSAFHLKPIFKKTARKERLRPYEKWIVTIGAVVLILFISYVWAYAGITKGSYIFGALIFSAVVYLVVLTLLYRRKTNDLSSFSTSQKADKKVSEEDTNRLIGRLRKVMTEKELFKNPNLKIGNLAKELNISAHQLSQLLNSYLGKNFTLFVNEYRIDEACKLLAEKTNLSIDAIGAEVGFNSKSTFFATFKKLKGMTPSAFQQEMSTNL